MAVERVSNPFYTDTEMSDTLRFVRPAGSEQRASATCNSESELV